MLIDQRRRRVMMPAEIQKKLTSLYNQPRNTLYPEHAVVINLPQSADRLKAFKEKNVLTIPIEVIEAVDGSKEPPLSHIRPGDLGCLLSHQKALKHAERQGWEMVMVFEDDAVVVPDFERRVREVMKELPSNWDMFWLFSSDIRNMAAVPYSPNLKILQGSWGTYGYIIRKQCYRFFIDLFEGRKTHSDDYYRQYQAKYNSFRVNEPLVKHTGFASDRLNINTK